MRAIKSAKETGAGCRASKVSDYLGILILLQQAKTKQNKTTPKQNKAKLKPTTHTCKKIPSKSSQ